MKPTKQQIMEASEEQLDAWLSDFFGGSIQLYSTNIGLCYQAEEKIREIKQENEYANQLCYIVCGGWISLDFIEEILFDFIHASPKQRVQAMLLTIREE